MRLSFMFLSVILLISQRAFVRSMVRWVVDCLLSLFSD